MGAAASGPGLGRARAWAALACGRRRRPEEEGEAAGCPRVAKEALAEEEEEERSPGQEAEGEAAAAVAVAAAGLREPLEESAGEPRRAPAEEQRGERPEQPLEEPVKEPLVESLEGPPPEPAEEESAQAAPSQWACGSLVERLLDDISDIWVGAVVIAAHEGELYDVEYPDDGSVERDVEGHELRRRNFRMDVPAEVWVYVGLCFYGKAEICAFEALSRSPQQAAQREAKRIWCTAYHERFSRCGPRCTFSRASGAADAAKAIEGCIEAADLGLTPVDRMSWKTRFAEQERFCSPSWRDEPPADSASPGDAAYGVSGKKLRHTSLDGRLCYGANALTGWYYDPRLGRMVREC